MAAVLVVAIGIVLRGYCREPPKPGVALADKLRAYLAQPAAGMTADLAPGTLLRVTNMALVALPGQAYRNPTKLACEWRDIMQAGRFEDSLKMTGAAEADILAFLGHSGSSQALEAHRVASAITEIEGLQRKEVTELQLEDAALRPELSTTLASGEGVVVIQTVFKARSMKITYRDAHGASAGVSLPRSALPGTLKSEMSTATSGVEEYADVILGYKALFIAGGQGSAMTAATADELAKVSADKGYAAKAIGNLVLVEVTEGTAPQLSALSRAAVDRDKVKASGDAPRAADMKRRQDDMVKRIPPRAELIKPGGRMLRPVPRTPR